MREKTDILGNKIELPETKLEFIEELNISETQLKKDIREIYFELVKIFEYYMDDTPENIIFYSNWIIGTAFMKQFYCYPYLFLNAMRGSGKSRLLKLLAEIGSGRYTGSITEPLIFRTEGLLCIDELESIGSKDKTALRELLNASYKKGMTIIRMRKKKGIDGEQQVPEEFQPYRPIAMANIWGMDEVLGDRCITRILEKSNNPLKTKRNENFDQNPAVQYVKMKLVQCSVCNVVLKKNIELWNKYLDTIHNYTHYTNYTNYTNYTFSDQELAFFDKINASGIYGRNLELFFPILIIANLIGDDIFDVVLEIAVKMNNEKRETEIQESSDVLVYNFVSEQTNSLGFVPIKDLFYRFKNYSQLEGDWVNDRWFGKALKRLNLIIDKRRKTFGIEVILNVAKAKEKIKIFQNE